MKGVNRVFGLNGGKATGPAFKPRWWAPRSMFGRNLLLLVALILLAEAGIGLLFRQWIQAPRMAAMQQFVVVQAQAQRDFLLHLDGASRAQWQQRLSARFGLAGEPQAAEPDSLWLARFMQNLTQELNPAQFQVRWQQQPLPGLWLGMRVGQQWLWQELDSSALHPNLPSLMLWVLLGGGVLAVLGAYLIQRRINRPLQQLAAAALAFGQGQAQNLPMPFETSQTAPLEIAQLAHSMQRMAHDLALAEQERELMLAGVSHDLRTPLTKLRLAVEILSGSALAAEEAPLLQGMVQHIASANQVIGQFIDFARSGSDEAQQAVDIAPMLAQLLQELSPQDRAQVQLQVQADLPALLCRPVALRRAVQNLLDNALRYGMPQADSPWANTAASITLQACSQNGQMVISVADRGQGIPAHEQARMRQPFARLQQAGTSSGARVHTAGAGAGAGLGLAIVERIVRLHHGQMLLMQRDGGGLQVSLLVPLAGS